MIISFANSDTEKVFIQEYTKSFSLELQKAALRKLIMIDNASCFRDLLSPPSNHLEKMNGKDNIWSIRINDQWRICFSPSDDWKNFYNVVIVDYH